jgi:PBP1b-binding outer membrane lipoprotein LpoB
MKQSKVVLLLITSALALQGCAHSATEKQVDKEVAQEANIKTNADLNAEADKTIDNAQGLSETQKAKLTALRETTKTQIEEARVESLKLRAALIKDVVSTTDKSAEIDLIKKKLKDLENKRLSATFKAIDQANIIMGRQANLNSMMMEEFFEFGNSHRD